MTQTAERRPLTRPAPPARRTAQSVLLPGALAAGWALAAGLVVLGLPVLLAWATDSRSGSGALAATKTIGQLWLVAHGAGLALPTGAMHLTPLGLTALPLLLLHRAGRHAARTAPPSGLGNALQLVLAMAVPYGLAAAVMAALAATHDVRPDPLAALVFGTAIGLMGAASGVLREVRLLSLVRVLPVELRDTVRAVAVATGVLLAGGAVLVGAAVALHGGRVTTLSSASDPGLLGGLALLLLGISFVPNAAIWGLSWITGPGFAVGVGTAVGPWSTHLGAVPAFPLLGALPNGQAPTWLGVLALLIPVAAGALGGVVASPDAGASWLVAAARGAAVAPGVALVCALLALVSGGPLGDGRLTAVGPSPWRVGVAVLLELLLPAALGSVVMTRRRG